MTGTQGLSFWLNSFHTVTQKKTIVLTLYKNKYKKISTKKSVTCAYWTAKSNK